MEKKDQLEEMLKDEFDRIAREEEDVLREENISIPEGTEENIYAGIQAKILEKEREKEKERLYAQLSEEDMKALELGRKIMEEGERKVRTVRKKKKARMYIGLVAAVVLTMAVGVTSMGGPERIIQIVSQTIVDRKVEKITNSDKVIRTVEENEEEAYQEIKEVFGVDPVKIMAYSENIQFENMEIDKNFQIAELFYRYDEKRIIYLINASYKKESLGIDMEDEIVDKYAKEVQGREIEIIEYRVSEGSDSRFQAHFEDRGLEYILIGTIKKEKFENILENLYFMG